MLHFAEKVVVKWGTDDNLVPCSVCPKTEHRLQDVETRFLTSQKDSLKEISVLRKKIRMFEGQAESLKKLCREGGGANVEDAMKEAISKDKELDMKVGGDNQLYEPIMAFEESTRDIMISIINEKVRTILTMDQSAFSGGKLPFGMVALPAEELAVKCEQLENENRALSNQMEKAREELYATTEQRDRFRDEVDQLRTKSEATIKRDQWSTQLDKEKEEKEAERRRIEEKDRVNSMIERYETTIAQLHKNIDIMRQRKQEVVEEVKVEKSTFEGSEEFNLKMKKELEAQAALHLSEREKSRLDLERTQDQLEKTQCILEKTQRALEECKAEIAAQPVETTEVIRIEPNVAPTVVDKPRETIIIRDDAKNIELMEEIDHLSLQQEASFEAAKKLVSVMRQLTRELKIEEVETDVEVLDLPNILCREQSKLQQVIRKTLEMAKFRENSAGELVLQIEQDKEIITKQKGELDRVQLMVEELRRRVVEVTKAAKEAGVSTEKMDEILEASGLKEVAYAQDKTSAIKVFQRLYNDAMDRLRRFTLLQAKIRLANGEPSPLEKEMPREASRKFRGVRDYCDNKIQEWTLASAYKTLPPEYFIFGWTPEDGEKNPFFRYMQILKTDGNSCDTNRRPLAAEDHPLWKSRNPPRPCEKRPVDRRDRTWMSTSVTEFGTQPAKQIRKQARSMQRFW